MSTTYAKVKSVLHDTEATIYTTSNHVVLFLTAGDSNIGIKVVLDETNFVDFLDGLVAAASQQFILKNANPPAENFLVRDS